MAVGRRVVWREEISFGCAHDFEEDSISWLEFDVESVERATTELE